MVRGAATLRQEAAGLSRYTAAIAPYALTIARVLAGAIFLLAGLGKFGGLTGFSGFVGSLGIPAAGLVGPLVATLEAVGGLLLIAGLGTRWVSLLFVIEMAITTLLVKLPNAGFMPAGKSGAGAEFDLLLLVVALVLLTHGGGLLSVEQNVLKREL